MFSGEFSSATHLCHTVALYSLESVALCWRIALSTPLLQSIFVPLYEPVVLVNINKCSLCTYALKFVLPAFLGGSALHGCSTVVGVPELKRAVWEV